MDVLNDDTNRNVAIAQTEKGSSDLAPLVRSVGIAVVEAMVRERNAAAFQCRLHRMGVMPCPSR